MGNKNNDNKILFTFSNISFNKDGYNNIEVHYTITYKDISNNFRFDIPITDFMELKSIEEVISKIHISQSQIEFFLLSDKLAKFNRDAKNRSYVRDVTVLAVSNTL